MKSMQISLFFFFNDTATTEIYTLSLHDALPIFKIPSKYEPVEYAIIDPLKTKQMRTTLPPKQQSYESDV